MNVPGKEVFKVSFRQFITIVTIDGMRKKCAVLKIFFADKGGFNGNDIVHIDEMKDTINLGRDKYVHTE